jgi:membrane protein required for colicin V production
MSIFLTSVTKKLVFSCRHYIAKEFLTISKRAMDLNFDLHFSLLDFIIIIVLIWGIYKGYMQGFIVQTIALFTLLAGIYIAAVLAMGFYNLLIDKSAIPLRNLPVIAFSVLFGPVLYATNWVALNVLRQVSSVPQNMYKKVLGAFCGALKYLFILSIFMIFIDRLDSSFQILTQNEHKRTNLFGPVSKFAPTIIPKLKFEVREPKAIELEDYTEEPKGE